MRTCAWSARSPGVWGLLKRSNKGLQRSDYSGKSTWLCEVEHPIGLMKLCQCFPPKLECIPLKWAEGEWVQSLDGLTSLRAEREWVQSLDGLKSLKEWIPSPWCYSFQPFIPVSQLLKKDKMGTETNYWDEGIVLRCPLHCVLASEIIIHWSRISEQKNISHFRLSSLTRSHFMRPNIESQ